MSRYECLTPVDLVCSICGTKQTIQRKSGKLYSKQGGHLKKLWCYRCKVEVNHVEMARVSGR
jgi:hypothetical protein